MSNFSRGSLLLTASHPFPLALTSGIDTNFVVALMSVYLSFWGTHIFHRFSESSIDWSTLVLGFWHDVVRVALMQKTIGINWLAYLLHPSFGLSVCNLAVCPRNVVTLGRRVVVNDNVVSLGLCCQTLSKLLNVRLHPLFPFFILSFNSFNNEITEYTIFRKRLLPTEGCRMGKLSDSGRIQSSDLHVEVQWC